MGAASYHAHITINLPRNCPDTEARGGTTSHPTSSRAAQPNSLTSDFTPVTRVTDISPHPRNGHFTRDFTTPASGTFHPGFHHTRVREHSAGRRARRRKHTSRRVRCVSPERAERSRAVAFNRSLWVSRVHSRDILLSSSEALRSFTRSLARSDIPFRAHKCWQSCPETPREAPASSAALCHLMPLGSALVTSGVAVDPASRMSLRAKPATNRRSDRGFGL